MSAIGSCIQCTDRRMQDICPLPVSHHRAHPIPVPGANPMVRLSVPYPTRSVVTFPAAGHHRPLTGTNYTAYDDGGTGVPRLLPKTAGILTRHVLSRKSRSLTVTVTSPGHPYPYVTQNPNHNSDGRITKKSSPITPVVTL